MPPSTLPPTGTTDRRAGTFATLALSAQGLRGTTEGGHRVIAAAAAHFDGTFDRLERMRRKRNAAEYPETDTREIIDGDARDAIDAAHRMREAAVGVVDSGKLGIFDA